MVQSKMCSHREEGRTQKLVWADWCGNSHTLPAMLLVKEPLNYDLLFSFIRYKLKYVRNYLFSALLSATPVYAVTYYNIVLNSQ